MALSNTDILFASLVGSKIVEQIPRFTAVQNELMKHVLPPIPFLPLKNEVGIARTNGSLEADLWTADAPRPANEQFFPLTFQLPTRERFLLPYEPMVTINGKNTIVRRHVAKAKPKTGGEVGGSIKERWTQGDYEITITGVLMGSLLTGDVSGCFPKEDFEKLRQVMTAPASLQVFCPPLELLGIHRLVIEDFSFPFTKGENVQAYEIKAYSDFDYKLLLELSDTN